MEVINKLDVEWVHILFAVSLTILALSKVAKRMAFQGVSSVFFNDRFIKTSIATEQEIRALHVSMQLVFSLMLSFFIFLVVTYYHEDLFSLEEYLTLLTLISFFLLARYYLNQLLATVLDYESVNNKARYFKKNYRSALSLVLIVINLLCFYVFRNNPNMLLVSAITLIALHVYTGIMMYRNLDSLDNNNLFYFILYLCALEIAPYLLLYKFVIKDA